MSILTVQFTRWKSNCNWRRLFQMQNPDAKPTMVWAASRHKHGPVRHQFWMAACGRCFEKGYTAWSTFGKETDYFGSTAQQYMINYRVDDLEALVKNWERKVLPSWMKWKFMNTESLFISWILKVTGLNCGEANDAQYGNMLNAVIK